MLDGELTFEVNGQRTPARQGDFAFAPRGDHQSPDQREQDGDVEDDVGHRVGADADDAQVCPDEGKCQGEGLGGQADPARP